MYSKLFGCSYTHQEAVIDMNDGPMIRDVFLLSTNRKLRCQGKGAGLGEQQVGLCLCSSDNLIQSNSKSDGAASPEPAVKL